LGGGEVVNESASDLEVHVKPLENAMVFRISIEVHRSQTRIKYIENWGEETQQKLRRRMKEVSSNVAGSDLDAELSFN
jgi:hypothetical protein